LPLANHDTKAKPMPTSPELQSRLSVALSTDPDPTEERLLPVKSSPVISGQLSS
jgi:hypothetical protein